MLTWIVIALVVVPLILLGLAVRLLLAPLPQLRRAVLTLQRRATEAQALRESAVALTARAEQLQQQMETAQQRVTLIKAKRGH